MTFDRLLRSAQVWKRHNDEVAALEARIADLTYALETLADAATALENRAIRSGGEFHVWAEERMVTDARDEALARLRGES